LFHFWAAAGLSQVVGLCQALAQRACGGSQGRLRTTRAIACQTAELPSSIPAAGGLIKKNGKTAKLPPIVLPTKNHTL